MVGEAQLCRLCHKFLRIYKQLIILCRKYDLPEDMKPRILYVFKTLRQYLTGDIRSSWKLPTLFSPYPFLHDKGALGPLWYPPLELLPFCSILALLSAQFHPEFIDSV